MASPLAAPQTTAVGLPPGVSIAGPAPQAASGLPPGVSVAGPAESAGLPPGVTVAGPAPNSVLPSGSRFQAGSLRDTPDPNFKPFTMSDYGHAGATALDSATFGADRLLPSSISGPLAADRADLAQRHPDISQIANLAGGMASPVGLAVGPAEALLPDAVKGSKALMGLTRTATGSGLGAAYSAGTGGNVTAGALGGAALGAAAPLVGSMAGITAPKADPLADVDPVTLQSRAHLGTAITQRMEQAKAAGTPITATQAVKGLTTDLNAAIALHGKALVADPDITPNQAEVLKTYIPALRQQANVSTNNLGVDSNGAADGSAGTALQQIQAAGISPAKTAPLISGLRMLDAASQNKFLNQTSGPAAAIGAHVGKALPGIGLSTLGLAHHSLAEAALGGVVGVIPGLSDYGGKVGAAAGSALDRATGSAVPPIIKQGTAASARLAAVGVPQSPSPLRTLQDLNAARANTPDPNAGLTTAQIGALRMKQQIMDKANATMATEGLPAKGDSVAVAQHVENVLQAKRNAIDPPVGESTGPSGRASASPGPATPTPPPAAPSAPTGTIEGLPAHLSGMSGWGPAGVPLTPEELHAGVESALKNGKLAPWQADQITHHLTNNLPMVNNGGRSDAAFNAVIQHSLALKLGEEVQPTDSTYPRRQSAAAGVPNGGIPVDNAYQANMAANGYHANAGDLARMAQAAGNDPLGVQILHIAGEPKVSAKQAMAQHFIDAEIDPIKKAQAQLFLKGRLLTQGKK